MRRTCAVLAPALMAVGVVGATPAGAQENGPGDPLWGDVNADGVVDRVVLGLASAGTCSVTVQLGNSAGGYDPPVSYSYPDPGTIGYCPDMGVVVDLGGDGQVELVLTHFDLRPDGQDYDLLVLRDFTPAGGFVAIDQPSAIGLADFNGDGLQDVYEWTDQGDGFQSWLNTPGSQLVPGPVRHCGVNSGDFSLADFDGDGATDLLAPYLNESCDPNLPFMGVNVVLDDGTVVVLQDDELSNDVWSARAFDADGDGDLDVETTNSDTGAVTVFYGNGDGTFVPGPK